MTRKQKIEHKIGNIFRRAYLARALTHVGFGMRKGEYRFRLNTTYGLWCYLKVKRLQAKLGGKPYFGGRVE